MHEGALVGDGGVGAYEDVVCDGLAEDFDFEDVGNDLFGFSVDVWVDEGDIVVAGDDVAQSTESLFNALQCDRVW